MTPDQVTAATQALQEAPKYAAVPQYLMEQIVQYLETRTFKEVEHLMLPIRMGAIRQVNVTPETPPDADPK